MGAIANEASGETDAGVAFRGGRLPAADNPFFMDEAAEAFRPAPVAAPWKRSQMKAARSVFVFPGDEQAVTKGIFMAAEKMALPKKRRRDDDDAALYRNKATPSRRLLESAGRGVASNVGSPSSPFAFPPTASDPTARPVASEKAKGATSSKAKAMSRLQKSATTSIASKPLPLPPPPSLNVPARVAASFEVESSDESGQVGESAAEDVFAVSSSAASSSSSSSSDLDDVIFANRRTLVTTSSDEEEAKEEARPRFAAKGRGRGRPPNMAAKGKGSPAGKGKGKGKRGRPRKTTPPRKRATDKETAVERAPTGRESVRRAVTKRTTYRDTLSLAEMVVSDSEDERPQPYARRRSRAAEAESEADPDAEMNRRLSAGRHLQPAVFGDDSAISVVPDSQPVLGASTVSMEAPSTYTPRQNHARPRDKGKEKAEESADESSDGASVVSSTDSYESDGAPAVDVGAPPVEVVLAPARYVQVQRTVEDEALEQCRTYIRRQQSGGALPAKLPCLEGQCEALGTVLNRVLDYGENQSVLLMGPRGAGKTSVLRYALENLVPRNAFRTVSLHGLMQTDDTLAVKEIATQLGYVEEFERAKPGNFMEAIQFVMAKLRRTGYSDGQETGAVSAGDDERPVLLMMDEFDHFARTKQTLLYTIFDAMTSNEVHMAVVGVTARIDALEMLEKRVQSRFSQRQIFCSPPSNEEQMMEIIKMSMRLPDDFPFPDFRDEFNRNTERFLDDPLVVGIVSERFNVRRDVRWFYRFIKVAMDRLKPDRPFLERADLDEAKRVLSRSPLEDLLLGLSVLELALLVAMMKLEDAEMVPYNFEMVFDTYSTAAKPTFGGQAVFPVFNKAVAMKAMERIVDLRIVKVVESAASHSRKEFQSVRLMIESSQVLQVVQRHEECPITLRFWACQWQT